MDQFGRRWAASKQCTFISVKMRPRLDVTDALTPLGVHTVSQSGIVFEGVISSAPRFIIDRLTLLHQNPSRRLSWTDLFITAFCSLGNSRSVELLG